MDSNKGGIQAAILFILALLAIPIALVLYDCGPGGSGVLASMELQDGKKYRISQQFNWSAEPYTVSFLIDEGTGKWSSLYVDHEAWRWRDVVMTYDAAGDRVIVTEQGVPRVIVDRKRDTYLFDNSQFQREEKLADHRKRP